MAARCCKVQHPTSLRHHFGDSCAAAETDAACRHLESASVCGSLHRLKQQG